LWRRVILTTGAPIGSRCGWARWTHADVC
jgi:hypothetical protein